MLHTSVAKLAHHHVAHRHAPARLLRLKHCFAICHICSPHASQRGNKAPCGPSLGTVEVDAKLTTTVGWYAERCRRSAAAH